MNPLLELFTTATAFDVVSRATFALAASALVAAVLRRASASVRHLIWASALAGAVAMPLLMIALPTWRVALPTRSKSADRPPIPVESTSHVLAERKSETLA